MQILKVFSLKLPEIQVIRFARFQDNRGYFCEHYRQSNFLQSIELQHFRHTPFVQSNESFSKKGVMRGMHVQFSPYQGKLVRTVMGHMVDMVLDIRPDSPTYGKMLLYDMPANPEQTSSDWIWVPPGFAHGNFFLHDSMIEYFCTGEFVGEHVATISPWATDIDWSWCEETLYRKFHNLKPEQVIMTDRDHKGLSMQAWSEHPGAVQFKKEIILNAIRTI